jgi:hypothetical protein
MTSPKPFDPAKYREGSIVLVSSRPTLDEFLHNWKWHHKLQPEQLDFAGRKAKVRASFMYHGGDVLYELEGIPGIWHEQCLNPGGNDVSA